MSYFDLLRLLRNNINPKEISLTLNNEERKYICLENIDNKIDKFSFFLGDTLSNKGKL